jgi:hypothetical protein
MHGRILLVAALLIAGCTDETAPPTAPRESTSPLARSFDPATTGVIDGRVVWEGDLPVAQEFVVRSIAYNPRLYERPARFTTPNLPIVDAKTRGVADAVVFLKNVDPRRARPWDHAGVRVEFRERQLSIQQGDLRSHVGFVQKGATISVVNCDKEYHLLRGRGAAFFALPLVETNQTHERKLARPGIVDLTCGVGYYWLSAHVFVTEHPYYARTDAQGRFKLERVPNGVYEIVCWLPNWRVLRAERDPETADVARWIWAEPPEWTRSVRVEAGQGSEVHFRIDAAAINR